jgi:hypothetical protein
MLKLLSQGCMVALVVGTVFRFTLLAQGLSEARLLPASWRRWLYDTKDAKRTS